MERYPGRVKARFRKKAADAERITIGTEQASTSGSNVDFSIPSGTKRVIITFEGVSLDGNDAILVQLGDSGGIESSSYVSSASRLVNGSSVVATSSTSGFLIQQALAADVLTGHMTLVLSDETNNTWISSHDVKFSTTRTGNGAGSKSLDSELTDIRITRNGTDSFDAGAINIQTEQ